MKHSHQIFHEQKMNWRRQIVQFKKLLESVAEKDIENQEDKKNI